MNNEQLLEIHSRAVEFESIKYIYVEDDRSILVKLNNSILKISNVDYQYKNSVCEIIDPDNCVFVDKNYLDNLLDNMFK
jgi:hypothetical protein